MEFMVTQDRRSAQTEKCISDMSKQVGKLAKAVEGLCTALGPAMRDSIKNELGPKVQDMKDVVSDVRRAAVDLSQAASLVSMTKQMQQQPMQPQMMSPSPMMDRGMIEYIVHQAMQNGGGGGGMMMGGGMGGAQNTQQGGGGGNDGMSWSQRKREAQAEQTPTRDRDLSEGGLASKGMMPHQRGADSREEDERKAREARERKDAEEKKRKQEEETKRREKEQLEKAEREREKESGKHKKPVNPNALSEDEMKKIHSAIRWNKPLGELAALITNADQANCTDPRNGNRALHIAAQNGFTPVCKLLIAKGAEVNAVNGKDNTALHMALGYDYDECAEFLYSSGADGTIVNSEGHAAKNGLEGDKGPDGFVAPLAELREARTPEESLKALERIKTEGLGNDDKAGLVQCGMLKKKNFPESWTPQVQDAFKDLIMSM